MKNRHRKLAIDTGEVVARNLFEVFQKPGNAGKNFTWEEFPDLVGRFSTTAIMMNCGDWDRLDQETRKEIQSITKESAIKWATALRDEWSGSSAGRAPA